MCICVGPPDVIVKGSFTVLIGGMPAARIGDITAHGGVIVIGPCPTSSSARPAAVPATRRRARPGAGEGEGVARHRGGFLGSAEQAETLIQAAKDGVPFAEICMMNRPDGQR